MTIESVMELMTIAKLVETLHSSHPPNPTFSQTFVKLPASIGRAKRVDPRIPVVIFGIGIAAFVLYFLMFAIGFKGGNDFYKEAWPPYRLLFHGHVLGFIRSGPAYTGSLVLRAPFAAVAALFGAGRLASYIATALPCVFAPAVLAAWLVPYRRKSHETLRAGQPRRVWPLDLFMLTPAAIICINEGHPEDILGAALCVAAVLLAQRGSARAAGIMLGIALINKSWAIIAVPLVIALMPADRRRAGFGTAVVVAAVVMIPVEVIRMTGSNGGGTGLGGGVGGIFLIPQLLWFFGRNSWVAREGHFILIAVGWMVTVAWWWSRVHGSRERPGAADALMILALVFFLRAVLDPWDNGYYFVPFMMAIMTYEDRGGFPKLTWSFVIMLLIFIPPEGLLNALGNNGHAAVFAVWALATIAYFSRRAFTPSRQRSGRLYAAASRSGS